MGKNHYKIGLYVIMCRLFLIDNWCGKAYLPLHGATPELARPGYCKKAGWAKQPRASQEDMPTFLRLDSCLVWFPALTSLTIELW